MRMSNRGMKQRDNFNMTIEKCRIVKKRVIEGLSIKEACDMVGLSRGTYSNYRHKHKELINK